MTNSTTNQSSLLEQLLSKAEVRLTKPQLRKLAKQATSAAEAKSRPRRRNLTEADRHAIRETTEHPKEVMKKYGIKINTIRAIKAGGSSYASRHASIDKWYAYLGRWSEQIKKLRKDQNARCLSRPTRAKDPSDRILDVLTSSEPPSALMERLDYSVCTIRQIKSGTGYYKSKGGSNDIWNEYRELHKREIIRLMRESR